MGSDSFSEVPLTEMTRNRLEGLHRALIHLHKVLLDNERAAYEEVHGPALGSGHMLNLVMSDPWFDWLHSISKLIVQIDEITEDDSAEEEKAFALLDKARQLFRTSTENSEFMHRYKAVLQREPEAVLAHIEVQRWLEPER